MKIESPIKQDSGLGGVIIVDEVSFSVPVLSLLIEMNSRITNL